MRFMTLLALSAALAACSGSGDRAAAPAGPAPAQTAEVPPSVSPKSTFELEAPPVAEVGNLCNFRQRQDPIMSGYKDRTGSQWQGEIRMKDVAMMDPKFFSPQDRRVATVVARPRGQSFRIRVDDNCYDATRKTYHACSKTLEADISKVRGFARAAEVRDARALAIQLCEQKVAEVVQTTLDFSQDNTELRCRVMAQAFCELPPAPPPPAAPAKK